MTSGSAFDPISKRELFAQLAAGHSAGVTVLTPNRRLAQTLAREFDSKQASSGLAVWEGADILPLGAFVQRLHDDALSSDIGGHMPLLLTPAQEQELWEAVIRSSESGSLLLTVARTASDCRRAWNLAHAWRIAGALGSIPGNEDARVFAEWTRAYLARCDRQGHTDSARLPDVVAPLLAGPAVRKPQRIVAYAFDVMPPQIRELLDACVSLAMDVRVCAPQARQARALRMSFASAREELEAAACWARDRCEAGAQQIGVVIPDLGQRRKEVARVFARVMEPARNQPGAVRNALPFNLSLGAPLGDFPLVRAALRILELAFGEVDFEHASHVIRSPFLGAAESESMLRASLDAQLRRHAPAQLTLGKLVGLIDKAPMLRERLEALFLRTREQTADERSPVEWAHHYSAQLKDAGFPGERSLDSEEFQTYAKLNETLAEFAKLERITPRMPTMQALARLRRMCADTLFQPETPDAPIQVLGAIESSGLEFDALWVSGLTDEAWPLPASPNPFIPPVLQRKAGIPEASAEAALMRARQITEGWLAAADEVRVSCPSLEQDRELLPSPLIAAIPVASADVKLFPRHRDLIFSMRRIESMPDARAPALATRTPRGGTRVLADQAACPFRAFARHRLAAESLEEPVAGLDARDRGQLLHTLMKELWSDLKGSEGLLRDCEPAIARAAAVAVREAQVEEPFAELERQRLARLAREWLAVERDRPTFRVVATEEKRKLAVAGLELNGRIDRMDRLEAGGYVLIDYKTGRPTPRDWAGDRPDDPQLPLYAVNAPEEIAAIAFARLKTGEMRFMGCASQQALLPDVKASGEWSAVLAGWKSAIEALGVGFATGDARVDPKKLLQTCRYCDLQPLCRVYEKINVLAEIENGAEEP